MFIFTKSDDDAVMNIYNNRVGLVGDSIKAKRSKDV